MRILCIIPARGGSKGIPDKNIADIKGMPLIAYSILPALNVMKQNLISRVIVSTDSEKIAEIAGNLGAEIPFLRPEEISGDTSKSIDFIIHALNFYASRNEYYDAVLLLQPTSPLRTEADIAAAISLFENHPNDSLISVYEEEYINDLVMYRQGSDGYSSEPLNPLHNKGVRRQDHGSLYVRNGCIYISRTELLRQGLIIGDKPLMYIMPKSKSVNLDTPEDLNLLRKLL